MLKLKVLVVEDDPISEILFSEQVKSFAKEVLYATTGMEALEICNKNADIDLVLMDIRLPDISGYDVTRKIREFNKDLIIIAQTAYVVPGEELKAKEAGCNNFITKPIRKDELIRLVTGYFSV